MKKFILFLAFLFIIPMNTLALDYVATASGNRIFHSKADTDKHGFRAYTDLYIDISNIENLDSLTMWVKYDTNLIGLQGCMHLYVANGGCPWYQDSVYFKYTYKEGWHDRLNKYSFYHVTFMPKDSTPTSGTTEVRVEFENAKDKEGNEVYIEPLILEYTFQPLTFKWNGPTQTPEQENNEDNVDSNINQDNDSTNVSKEDLVSISDINQNASINVPNNNTNVLVEEVKKSNNTNIKQLNIVGYEIDFNKDIYEYTIEIDTKLEKLDMNVETEDKKSTVSIEGNSNLSNNDSNVIKIKVTAEDLSESEYLIKTVSKKEQIETNQDIDIQEENNNQTNNFNEIITYSFMVVVLLVLMIVIIKKYLKNTK